MMNQHLIPPAKSAALIGITDNDPETLQSTVVSTVVRAISRLENFAVHVKRTPVST